MKTASFSVLYIYKATDLIYENKYLNIRLLRLSQTVTSVNPGTEQKIMD